MIHLPVDPICSWYIVGPPTQRVKLISTPVSKNWNFGKEGKIILCWHWLCVCVGGEGIYVGDGDSGLGDAYKHNSPIPTYSYIQIPFSAF